MLIAIETPTLALLVMGAIALIVIILVLASRRPGPSGMSVYDVSEPPENEPPLAEQSQEEEDEPGEDEDSA